MGFVNKNMLLKRNPWAQEEPLSTEYHVEHISTTLEGIETITTIYAKSWKHLANQLRIMGIPPVNIIAVYTENQVREANQRARQVEELMKSL